MSKLVATMARGVKGASSSFSVRRLANARHFSGTGSASNICSQKATPINSRICRLNQPTIQTDSQDFNGPIQACILGWEGVVTDAYSFSTVKSLVEVFGKHGVQITFDQARLALNETGYRQIDQILNLDDVRHQWTSQHGKLPTESTSKEIYERDFIPIQTNAMSQEEFSELLPGVSEVISNLRMDFGLKFGSTSDLAASMMDILVDQARLQGLVLESVVTKDNLQMDRSSGSSSSSSNNNSDMGHRPLPFMIYQNLFNLGVWPISSVVKIDDSCSGIAEGINAGCWTVGVHGYSKYTSINSSLNESDYMCEIQARKCRERARDRLIEESGAHYIMHDLRDLPVVLFDINRRLEQGEIPLMMNRMVHTFHDDRNHTPRMRSL